MDAFKTEAELCAAFAPVATAAGWTVYPETCGWDQLLVSGGGEQIGVQAKLRPNYEVLCQALEEYGSGPDWRCVLVGKTVNHFAAICHHLRLICVSPFTHRDSLIFPNLSHLQDRKWTPKQRHALPAYLPDVPAGVPCPVQLTDWKIKAIRLCAILRIRGHLTAADFTTHKINRQRWFVGKTRWLQPVHLKRGVYVAVPGMRLPDEDHPIVAAQIRDEIAATLSGVA